MWVKFVKTYRYHNRVNFEKGEKRFLNNTLFAQYLIEKGYATKE